MTSDEEKRLRFAGRAGVCCTLVHMAQAGWDTEKLRVYATGMAEGLRDALIAYCGEQAAYEALQSVADATAIVVKAPT